MSKKAFSNSSTNVFSSSRLPKFSPKLFIHSSILINLNRLRIWILTVTRIFWRFLPERNYKVYCPICWMKTNSCRLTASAPCHVTMKSTRTNFTWTERPTKLTMFRGSPIPSCSAATAIGGDQYGSVVSNTLFRFQNIGISISFGIL